MTAKHLVEGLVRTLKGTHNRCTQLLELPQGTLCRMQKGKSKDMRVSTLTHIHQKSGIPVDVLVGWYAMSDDEVVVPANVTKVDKQQLLLDSPDVQLDTSLKQLIAGWEREPIAIQVLEALDYCTKNPSVSGFTVSLLRTLLDNAMRRERLTYGDLVTKATWRKG